MLCGCAVAASDQVGAARDLITDGRTGFVYPCGDVAALTALLQKTADDPARLLQVRQAARARMASWSPRENIEATMEAVSRAVSGVAGHAALSKLTDGL